MALVTFILSESIKLLEQVYISMYFFLYLNSGITTQQFAYVNMIVIQSAIEDAMETSLPKHWYTPKVCILKYNCNAISNILEYRV
jgi:hypothetical protein